MNEGSRQKTLLLILCEREQGAFVLEDLPTALRMFRSCFVAGGHWRALTNITYVLSVQAMSM